MSMMLESKTVTTYIDCPPAQVYDYVRVPQNLPNWAKTFVHGIRLDEGTWKLDTALGLLDIRFAPHNVYGVLDHFIRFPNGDEAEVPMRVISNGPGSEVLFTIFRRPTQSESDFVRDQELVRSDLRTLKIVLEVE